MASQQGPTAIERMAVLDLAEEDGWRALAMSGFWERDEGEWWRLTSGGLPTTSSGDGLREVEPMVDWCGGISWRAAVRMEMAVVNRGRRCNSVVVDNGGQRPVALSLEETADLRDEMAGIKEGGGEHRHCLRAGDKRRRRWDLGRRRISTEKAAAMEKMKEARGGVESLGAVREEHNSRRFGGDDGMRGNRGGDDRYRWVGRWQGNSGIILWVAQAAGKMACVRPWAAAMKVEEGRRGGARGGGDSGVEQRAPTA